MLNLPLNFDRFCHPLYLLLFAPFRYVAERRLLFLVVVLSAGSVDRLGVRVLHFSYGLLVGFALLHSEGLVKEPVEHGHLILSVKGIVCEHKLLLFRVWHTETLVHLRRYIEKARWLTLGGEVGQLFLLLVGDFLWSGSLWLRFFLLLARVDGIEIWELFLCHGDGALGYEARCSRNIHLAGEWVIGSFLLRWLLLHGLLHWLLLRHGHLLLTPHILLLLKLLLLLGLRILVSSIALVAVAPDILLGVLLLIILV